MDNLLYSKRKKLLEQGTQPEVYQYDRLPIEFRRQVVHIWVSAISAYESCTPYKFWEPIHRYFIRELGVFLLGKDRYASSEEQCINFLLEQTTPVDNILDLLELTFKCIDTEIRATQQHLQVAYDCQPPDNAIDELNHRFREHARLSRT